MRNHGKHPGSEKSPSNTAVKACSIIEAIGNTPLVYLRNTNRNPDVRICAKLEGNNPGGSIKDRPAWYMIMRAEESGELTPNKTILEATSGNTGIAIAMIGAARNYRVKLAMPGCVSMERRRILEAFGAETVLTPPEQGTDGAIMLVKRIFQEYPDRYYLPDQYSNRNNMLSHYETTGPEIYEQSGGDIDVIVVGMGTTGTLMGVGKYLKEKNPAIRIVGVEPTIGHKIQGLKNMQESLVPPLYNPDILDEKVTIEDEEAFETTRILAVREGILAGMSGGAAIACALKLSESMRCGTIATILPDRGDRYLSTALFRSVCAKCPP